MVTGFLAHIYNISYVHAKRVHVVQVWSYCVHQLADAAASHPQATLVALARPSQFE